MENSPRGSLTVRLVFPILMLAFQTAAVFAAAGPATHFSVVAATPVAALNQSTVNVTALDASNNTATGYTGTVHFTSTADPNAIYSSGQDVTLINGVGAFNIAFRKSGTFTITATDSVNGSINGTSNSVQVNPGATVRLIVTAPGSVTAGVAFNITVTAVDLNNNTTPTFTGPVQFTSTDGNPSLPGPSSLTNGTGTFSVTLRTGGSQTITVKDIESAITGTSGAILVNILPPSLSIVFNPNNINAGNTTTLSFSFTNPNAGVALTGVAFTDTLPSGLVVATPNGLTGAAGGGTVTATAGSSSISLSGATLPAGGTSQFQITVVSSIAGTKVNTSGAISSTNAGTGNTASATLTVNPSFPASITISAGDNQTATVDTIVAIAPAVLVKDSFGNVVPNASIAFAVVTGGGSVTGSPAITNAQGIATLGSWKLGTVAGTNNNTLTASSTVSLRGTVTTSVTFKASATAAPAVQIAISAGDNQTATVNSNVPIAPAVLVEDSFGNAVPNVNINFVVATGGGSVTGTPALSNAQGIATLGSWKLGPTAGTNNNTLAASLPVSLRAASSTSVTFTASATAGPATQIAINAGNNQSALINSNVAIAPSVIVKDDNNNVVANAQVTFAVQSGGGSITGGSPLTDSNGIATLGSWKLGAVPGANTLSATLGGPVLLREIATAVVFTATGTSGSGDLNGDGIVTPIDTDTDGDGFPDYIETALGTNPASSESSPFTLADPLGIKFRAKVRMTLNAEARGTDEIVVNGYIHLVKGETISGAKLLLDIGGNAQTFTLNENGSASNENASFKLFARKINGQVADQEAQFKATFRNGGYAANIYTNSFEQKGPPAARGLARDPDHVVLTIVFNNSVLRANVPLKFKPLSGGGIRTFGLNTNAK